MKINFSINYKGYTADVSYEPEDKIYVGEVRGISDSLNFHGRSILEINTMFHQSIENYLDLCKQIGKTLKGLPTISLHAGFTPAFLIIRIVWQNRKQ